jgi:hypothetical protein
MTCALPLGIYRHSLTVTVDTGAVNASTIRGLSQSAGVIGTTDSTVLTASSGVVAWYGFGKQEEIYYRVTGTTSTTGTYTSTLATSTITPTAVAGVFNPGTIEITEVGQGHTTDTDMWLYDGDLNAIPCGGDDDNVGPPTSLQSRLSINLAAGTYYLAVSTYNLSNNQNSCVGTDNFLSGIVLDFPYAVTDSSTTIGSNLTFTVNDGTTMTQQVASKAAIFGVEWFRIQVGAPIAPAAYCFGTNANCPCANGGAAGNGCANSVNASGANLAATGSNSTSADSLVLTATGTPLHAPCLYFQGGSQVSTAFGDGLQCAGGPTVRLGTKISSGGTSSYPGAGDQSVSVRGGVIAGSARNYQAIYRDAGSFCTTDTFNLTNGVSVVWAP